MTQKIASGSVSKLSRFEPHRFWSKFANEQERGVLANIFQDFFFGVENRLLGKCLFTGTKGPSIINYKVENVLKMYTLGQNRDID